MSAPAAAPGYDPGVVSDPPRIATCLFDLDGTLIDSIDLIMASFRHTMRTHLGSVPDEAGWRAGFGTPLRSQLQAFAGDDEQAARMVATYRALDLSSYCPQAYEEGSNSVV